MVYRPVHYRFGALSVEVIQESRIWEVDFFYDEPVEVEIFSATDHVKDCSKIESFFLIYDEEYGSEKEPFIWDADSGLIDVLNRCSDFRIWHRIYRLSPNKVSVILKGPGEKWRMDFSPDGCDGIIIYRSDGKIYDECVLEGLFGSDDK
jgi:hypothetical protein